jgi:16S rRNA processing protein RimM
VSGDFLAIGRLGAPKGVRGDLKVHSYSGESAHFSKLKEATLRGGDSATGLQRELRLKVARIGGGGDGSDASLTIAFEGYASPEAARALTGMDIIVPRSEAAVLGPDEWYVTDLEGLSLTVGGEKVATVRTVLDGGSDPWLEVLLPAPIGREGRDSSSRAAKSPGGRTAIVPFRKEFVGVVDVEAGTIELLAPELLDE